MTEAEKIAMVKAMSGETDEDLISAYLMKAGEAVLGQMYKVWTNRPEGAAVPDKYAMDQCELAVRSIARIGAEGQTAHGENGISRTWASADDEDILRRITPLVEVPQ